MKTTKQILDVFQNFRMAPTPIDQYEQVGKQILSNRINQFVEKGDVIKFIMLGFPFKSTNVRDKVIGTMPDLAEEATLKNDLLGVSDETVAAYQEISADMGRVAPMSWFGLNDFFSGQMSSKRDKVMELLAPTPEKLEQDILMNPDVNFLYRGMIRFMMEELADKNYPSGNQLQKAAKKLTREMMMRNEAWSNLVKNEFSDRIRLSMHPSINNGAKYSFKLIPGDNAHYSAWHCAIYLNGNEYVTVYRKEANEKALELVYKEGRPYYFQKS